mmetsp:Transcript_2972/g.10595  ORF Transcript_2972/g.10595 Transcript_2972/m.10595 type:complete len:1529 (-) Transcript_2972:165-4751(-)
MPGTRKQQSQQSGGSGMILENDVDGRGKENDDEMRNVMKTTKRGGRSSKRGGKAPSTDAAVEEEEVFEEEEEEEIMVVEKEDVFMGEDDVEKKGNNNNNNNGEKSKNKPPKNPPKSLDALKARLEATKSKVSSKSNKERESETLGFIGEKETSGVPPTPGALLGGNDTTMNFGNATNAMDTVNINMDNTNNATTTTTTTNTGEMLVDNNSPATTVALDVPKIEVPEINIEALAAKHFDSALEEEISHSLNWKSIAPSHDFKNLVKERNNAISDFKKILPEVMRKKDRLVEDTVRATRGFQETVSTLQEHTARAAAQVQSARNEAKLAEQKLKSAKAEFVAREAKMLSNFSQNEEHKQQENETLRNELVEQSVQLQQKQKLLDQAEKKLKSFEKNSEKDSEQVLKLRDENIELEKQLAALKAENKEKEKAFASQSKTLEGQLKKQEADFEAKLASTEAAKVTSDQLAREMTAEKEASMVKLEVAEKEIAKLSESSGATNAALTEQNAKLEESLEKAEKELKKKEKELDQSSKHADKKLEGLNAEIAELQTLREQAVELEASLKTNCAELEKEKAVLEKKITSLEKDGDKKLSKIEKLEESIERVTGELKDTKSEFKTAESARKELSEQLVALQSKLNLESKSTELELANAHKEVKRYEDDLADAKAQAKSLIEQQGEMMGELKCARAELARLETERRDFEKNGSQTLQEAQEKCRADLKAQEKEFQKELKQERKQYDEKMEAERVKASESIEASRVENEKRINIEIKNTEKLSAQIEKLEKKLSKLEEAKKALETDLMNATQESGKNALELNQELENMKTALELAEELRTDLDADVERLTNELRIAKTEAEKAKENMAELIAEQKQQLTEQLEREKKSSEKAIKLETQKMSEKLVQKLERSEQKRRDLEARVTAAEAKEKELGEKIEVLRKQKAEAELGGAEKAEEIQAALEKLEAAKSETFGHEQRIASVVAQLENEQKEVGKLEKSLKSLDAEKAAEIENLKFELKESKKELKSLTNELDAMKEAQALLEEEEKDGKGGNSAGAALTRKLVEQAKAMENAKMDAMAADELRKLAEEKTQRIAELEGELLDAEALRRQMFNQIQELRGNVRVFCRVRPSGNDAATPCVETLPDTTSVNLQVGPKKSSAFSFDRAFGPESTQEEVFGEVSGLVQSALDGYKVCLFSYGQTGSGKTHTMLGGSDATSRGIIPRAVEKVVEASKINEVKGWSYTLKASYVEIYNETIRDLLSTVGHSDTTHKIIHENGSTTISGVTTAIVESVEQANVLVRKAAGARKVEATQMNAHSSRSHAVFILHVSGEHASSGTRMEGVLNLVDLAGSERVSRSGASGERLKEACSINKSLSSLGDVFAALASKAKHVPYRNSKLTYLLAPCLGGDGKTLMFVNVAPEEESAEETVASLRFASTVNAVELGHGKRAKRNVTSMWPSFGNSQLSKEPPSTSQQRRLSSRNLPPPSTAARRQSSGRLGSYGGQQTGQKRGRSAAEENTTSYGGGPSKTPRRTRGGRRWE